MVDHNERIRAAASVDEYDALYLSGGTYSRPYLRSIYYPLYRSTLAEVKRLGGTRILEVGCGSGSFAEVVFDRSDFDYSGFDFSTKAIEMAIRRTGRPQQFFVGDALNTDSYTPEYDAIVCNEVLEHIDNDLDVLSIWRAGSRCVCSVPNFDYDTHVRYFLSEQEVCDRYQDLIDIKRISRVAKPLFRGQSATEYLKDLRWSRGNPARFFALLGIRTFENLAGWFVFSGYRR